ncbi:hypothetical protein MLD38_010009 [Melastoma candidum]|uniref:Uncharacterized protein n=1 Tax=Melastoma candidum TaxID=119954 RepID=A0ACB9QYF3_9MYRT|nr:hypothetical protein MLD38_010009 [Melastoma candidum]
MANPEPGDNGTTSPQHFRPKALPASALPMLMGPTAALAVASLPATEPPDLTMSTEPTVDNPRSGSPFLLLSFGSPYPLDNSAKPAQTGKLLSTTANRWKPSAFDYR